MSRPAWLRRERLHKKRLHKVICRHHVVAYDDRRHHVVAHDCAISDLVCVLYIQRSHRVRYGVRLRSGRRTQEHTC
jgi:hypothetical protein